MQFFKRDSRTVSAAKVLAHKKTFYEKKKYYEITYHCIHDDKKFKSEGSGKRKMRWSINLSIISLPVLLFVYLFIYPFCINFINEVICLSIYHLFHFLCLFCYWFIYLFIASAWFGINCPFLSSGISRLSILPDEQPFLQGLASRPVPDVHPWSLLIWYRTTSHFHSVNPFPLFSQIVPQIWHFLSPRKSSCLNKKVIIHFSMMKYCLIYYCRDWKHSK